jgi:two-component system sensor histidine kinase UhpB
VPAETPTRLWSVLRSSEWPWREAAMVIGIAVLSVALSAHFQLTERLYTFTRRWEFLQLDEVPVGLGVLAIGLTWLSWRRTRQAQRELRARQRAEMQLQSVLAANRELTQEHLRVQESERKHLARELHDQLGQYLNAIKLDAVSIRDSSAVDIESVGRSVGEIIQTVDHVHGVVSDMIRRLRPVGLDELGLVAAIEHCVDQWRARLPQTRFALSVQGDFDHLPEAQALTLYRLIQEGLTNIHKHAQARRVDVLLERCPATADQVEQLLLRVTDDGRGMVPTAATSRFGLNGMRERVELAGGHFVLQSAPGCGLRFDVSMPAGVKA